MTFRGKMLRIRLEHAGAVVRECVTDGLPPETLVGRAEDCFWRVPPGDASVSSHHAALRRRHGGWVLVDTDSRNGVYFRGRAVVERKLSPGDVLSIGESRIVVEDAARTDGLPVAKYHILEQLSGEGKSTTIPLEHDITRVGSGRECEVRIADSLVSHVHALFEVRADGFCYVKDNASRNGVRVNGIRQTEEAALTGQMLKDGDVVSIAYVDFRFWDRNVRHVRTGLSRKVIVIVATLAVALGGYFSVLSFFPTSRDLRLRAERAAAAEDFDRAEALIVDAAGSRGAETDAAQRGELAQRIRRWKRTFADWQSARQALASGKADLWSENARLAALLGNDNENWTWNTENAVLEMKQARAAHALLSRYLSLLEKMGDDEADIASFAKLADDARNALSVTDGSAAYVVPIRNRLADLADELDATVADVTDLRRAFDEYVAISQTDRVCENVDTILGRNQARMQQRQVRALPCSSAVQRMGRELVEPLDGLRSALRIFESNCLAVARLDFGRLRAELGLPKPEACMGAVSLSSRRADLERENRQLLKMVTQLRSYQSYLQSHGVLSDPPDNEALTEFFDADRRRAALACDCLERSPPSYAQKKAESAYDSLLGVYVFFPYLNAVTDEFDTSVFEDRFKPTLFAAAEVFRSVEQFVRFCDVAGTSPYASLMARVFEAGGGGSVLAKQVSAMKALLGRRDGVVRELRELEAQDSKGRRGVLAGGMILALSTTAVTAEEERSRHDLALRIGAIRKATADVLQRADGKGPEARLRAESEVLRIGFPGDALLKQPWADRTKGK